jgi:glycosyltransferase involved in cell wall biosynthesis
MRVELVTDFTSPTGYAAHARTLITALLDCDIDLQLRLHKGDPAETPFEDEAVKFYEGMMGKTEKPDVRIHFEIPPFYTIEDGVYTIGMTMWETTKIPHAALGGQQKWDWPAAMNKVDEIWTSCTESQAAFERSQVKTPIYLITGPVDTDVFKPGLDELPIAEVTCDDKGNPTPRDQRRKCMAYMGAWTRRKNVEDWVAWLWSQFPRQKVCGLLKTHIGSLAQPDQNASVKKRIEETKSGCIAVAGPEIYYITDTLTDQEVARFFQTPDIYVSFSRGEGLDLPTLQAMASGCLVMHTNWGATTDYLDQETGFPLGAQLEPCRKCRAPYWGDQWWARVNTHQATVVAAKVLTSMDSGVEDIDKIREAARKVVVDRYSIPAVTAQLKARFEDIGQ